MRWGLDALVAQAVPQPATPSGGYAALIVFVVVALITTLPALIAAFNARKKAQVVEEVLSIVQHKADVTDVVLTQQDKRMDTMAAATGALTSLQKDMREVYASMVAQAEDTGSILARQAEILARANETTARALAATAACEKRETVLSARLQRLERAVGIPLSTIEDHDAKDPVLPDINYDDPIWHPGDPERRSGADKA